MFCFIFSFWLCLASVQNLGVEGGKAGTKPSNSALINVNWSEVLKQAEEAENGGNYEEALELYSEVVHNYDTKKKYIKALPIAWKLYKLQENILGKDDSETVKTLGQLGKIYYSKGNLQKAEDFLKRAYRLTKLKKGQDHEDTIQILFNLALVYSKKVDPQKLDLALRYFRKVYIVRSNDPQLGEEHEKTVEVLVQIGFGLILQSKPEEAAAIFQQALEIRSRRMGKNHPLTKEAEHFLFYTLSKAGKIGQAKKVIGKENEERIEDDFSFLTLVRGKAEALARKGKSAQALEMLSELFQLEVLKPDVSPEIQGVLEKLMSYSQKHGDLDQTLKWAQEALDFVENEKPKVKVRVEVEVGVTSKKELENIIRLHFHAIEAFVHVYLHKNDEEKLDKYFEAAVELIDGREESPSLRPRFLTLVRKVANFKEKIGKLDDALRLHEYIMENSSSHQSSVTALSIGSIITIALKKEDSQLLENIFLQFFPKTQEQDESERNQKSKMRENVAQSLLGKAREELNSENYEDAYSIYTTLEYIWPEKWTADNRMTETFLTGIIKSALKLDAFDEALLYAERRTTILENQLLQNSKLGDEERTRIVKRIEYNKELQPLLKESIELQNELYEIENELDQAGIYNDKSSAEKKRRSEL